MSYDIVPVYVGGKNSAEVKAEIQADASRQVPKMSVSEFMLACYHYWKENSPEAQDYKKK